MVTIVQIVILNNSHYVISGDISVKKIERLIYT